jgi:hypothetical protein
VTAARHAAWTFAAAPASPAVVLGGSLVLPAPVLQVAGTFAPLGALAGALALPQLTLVGSVVPAVSLVGSLVLPQLQLVGSEVTTFRALNGSLLLPQLQLAGTIAPAVSIVGGLVLPQLQVSGSFTVAWNPQIVSATALDFNNNTAANPTIGPLTVPIPARSIGERMIVAINRRQAGGQDFQISAGWIAVNAAAMVGSSSNDVHVYYQDVDASNVGTANVVFTSTVNYPPTQCVFWRLSGCDPSVAPVANGTLQNTTSVGTVNPTALTGPNAGAVQRNLWLVYIGMGGQQDNNGTLPVIQAGGWPAGYGSTGTSSTTVSSAANGVGQGWASKVAVAGSDDPSAWTYQTGIVQGRSFAINVCNRGVQ